MPEIVMGICAQEAFELRTFPSQQNIHILQHILGQTSPWTKENQIFIYKQTSQPILSGQQLHFNWPIFRNLRANVV